MPQETVRRSLLKSVGWRMIATASTFTIAYAVDARMSSALMIGVLDCAVNFTLHFAYERGFAHLRWGYVDDDDDNSVFKPSHLDPNPHEPSPHELAAAAPPSQ